MRDRTACTILDTLLRVTKVTSAAFTKSIKRTVTEQAVEMFGVYSFMAGKEFTFPVTEKFIVFGFLLVHNEKLYINSAVRAIILRP